MWHDSIVEEVRSNRQAYAARFHHDIKVICFAARKQQETSGHKVVSLSPRVVTTAMNTDSSNKNSTTKFHGDRIP